MSQRSPLVTIAIPTLSRLKYLKEAVAAALAQTYEEVEILIGDDGTSPEIEAWCRSISNKDPRVRYQRNKKRLGLAGNWNALADAAHGEFIVIIGDDDRLLPDFVSRLIEIIPPSAQVAFSNHYLIDDNGVRLLEESLQMTRHYFRDELPAGEIISPAITVWKNSIPMSAAIVSSDTVRRLRFKEDLNTPEIEFFARLVVENSRFFFTPEYLAEYRVHVKSETACGLRGETLVKYLAPLRVAEEVEPYKREFMASLLVNAVTRCLRQGDRKLAREFLDHEYYPRPRFGENSSEPGRKLGPERGFNQRIPNLRRILRDALTGCVQRLCVWLPAPVGYSAYRLLQSTKTHLVGH